MNEIAKVVIPAALGAVVGLLTYFGAQRWAKRSAQLNYIQTIFRHETIPRYFSALLWNARFLSNVSCFFPKLVIDDTGLERIQNTNTHTRIIIGILSYVAVQSSSILNEAKAEVDDPEDIHSFLLAAPLVGNRLSHPDIVSNFKKLLSSDENGDHELRQNLNKFIARETLRMSERTSYMSFLLPFACSPNIRQRLIGLIEDENIPETRRWREIENTVTIFLQGKRMPRKALIDKKA